MEPIARRTWASSTEEQTVNRERFRKEAEALGLFRAPEIPIPVFLEEGVEAVRAAHLYGKELEAVGMPAELPERLGGYLAGLRGAQAIWRTGSGEHPGQLEALVEQAREAKREARLISELALRHHPRGQRLLAATRDADTAQQLVAVLHELAVIPTTFRPEFEAIRVNPDDLANGLVRLAEELWEAKFAEESQRPGDEAKELRDRYYTLTLELLADLRAYAQFAFRKDKSPHRRQLFLSRYVRERNRKQLRKAKAAAGGGPGAGVVVATGAAADDTAERPEVVPEVA